MAEIRILNIDQLKDIYQKYMKKEFPARELRPYRSMIPLIRDKKYIAYGYFDGDQLESYACIFIQPEHLYAFVDYYAVIPELQGKGIGSSFLTDLIAAVPAENGMFIEVESVDTAKSDEEREIRKRRIQFYLNNGARMTAVKCRFVIVDFNIMYLPKNSKDNITDQSLYEAVCAFYHSIYGFLFQRVCKAFLDVPSSISPN